MEDGFYQNLTKEQWDEINSNFDIEDVKIEDVRRVVVKTSKHELRTAHPKGPLQTNIPGTTYLTLHIKNGQEKTYTNRN